MALTYPTTLVGALEKIQHGETSIDVLNRIALSDPGPKGSLWILDGNDHFFTRLNPNEFADFLRNLNGMQFSSFSEITTSRRLSGQNVTEYRVDDSISFYLYPDLGYVELAMDAFSIFISSISWIDRFGEPI